MGMNDKELSKLRMMSNGIIAQSNERNSWATAVEVRRTVKGASVTVAARPGGQRPSDIMLELGDLADAIRNELRLERNKLAASVYGTSESTFESEGHPKFQFEVWRLDEQ